MAFDANETWDKFAPWVTRAIKFAGGIGFLITVIYFMRIGNLPVDNLQSALGLVSVIALVSIALLLVFVVYWGLPTFWFWSKLDDGDWAIKAWFIGHKAAAPLSLLDDLPPSVEQSDAATQTAGLKVSAPRLFLWWTAVVAPPWTFFSALLLDSDDLVFKWVSWGSVFLALLLAVCTVTWYVSWEPPVEVIRTKGRVRGKRFTLAAGALFLNFASLLGFWLLLSKSDYAQGPASLTLWVLLLLGLALSVTIYAIASAYRLRFKTDRRSYLVLAAALSVALMWMGAELHVLGPIQDQVMVNVSVRLPEVTLVMNKSGCQAMAAAGLAPAAAASGPMSYESGCVLGPVLIKSRLGSRWPVACVGDGPDASGRLLTLKGDDVSDFLTARYPSVAASATSASTSTPSESARVTGHPRSEVANRTQASASQAQGLPKADLGYCNAFRRAPLLAEKP